MTALEQQWQSAMEQLPLVAILRGLESSEAIAVGTTLVEAGFRIIEVPLNSPDAFESVRLLANSVGNDAIIGTGTVLQSEDVELTVHSGGKLIVAPNFDKAVAAEAIRNNALYCPGVATPTEAFGALQAGAHALKLFPAEAIAPSAVTAMRAVLPTACQLLPVGGITPDNMPDYMAAGANGFGIGSALFKPGKTLSDLRTDAERFVATMNSSR